MMKRIYEYQQELLIAVLTRELPAFVRRGNYQDLRRSPAWMLLPDTYHDILRKLQEADALFTNNSCVFPYWADKSIRDVFALAQKLPGRNRGDFLSFLEQIETRILEERLNDNTGSAEVCPTTTDDPDVREWYTRRSTKGIRLLIPQVEQMVGRLGSGERLVIGGYAGSYKTVLLEHIIAAVLRDTTLPVLFVSSSRSEYDVRARLVKRADPFTADADRPNANGAISQLSTRLTVVGNDRYRRYGSLTELRQDVEQVLQAAGGPVVLAIDSLDGLAQLLHPRRMKIADSTASFIGGLEYVSNQWPGQLIIVATLRFTEWTYSKLRKRVEEWKWQRIRSRNESLALGVDPAEAEESDDTECPRGRYLISAFQDPPEVERFFDACLSMWVEPEVEDTRPVLARVVKNRHEETMDEPCMLRFSKDGASLQIFSLPDSEDMDKSLAALVEDGLI